MAESDPLVPAGSGVSRACFISTTTSADGLDLSDACRWSIDSEISGKGVSTKKHTIPGDLVDAIPFASRHDLTDEQWAVLEPLLPKGKKAGRPPKWTKRQLIDGIRWRARAGAPWRDVPSAYGPWQTVYGLFRRWQRGGRVVVDSVAVAGPGRRGRSHRVGRVGGLDRFPGPPARRGRPKRGTCRKNHRAESGLPNLTITRWDGHGRADHQDPPGLRARAEDPRRGHHRWPPR